MSEMYIKGRWKGKEKKAFNAFSPMIGMIFKSSENNVVGMLISINSNIAVLLTKEQKKVEVQVQSLKIIINE